MRLQTVEYKRRSTRRPVTAEARFRAEVSTQFANLQTDVARVTALLAEDRKQRHGSPWAWVLAFVVLLCSGLVVVAAIHQGLTASADAATAGRLRAQMDSTTSREERAIHPNVASASCTQSVAAAAKCRLRDNSIVFSGLQTVINDESKLQADLSSADRLEVEGPAVLAFGSALGGAVLGWMLTQLLGSDFRGPRRRAPKLSPLDRPVEP